MGIRSSALLSSARTVNLSEALDQAVRTLTASGITNARFDADLLLARVLGRDRTWIVTHARDVLDAGPDESFRGLIARRAEREPLQYILGSQEFWGRPFKVTRDVLIPRPETELVVEAALGFLTAVEQPTIIDLCTGSGCIAVSLAKELRSPRIFATDLSGAALTVARENAGINGCSDLIRFLEGDLFEPLRELDLQRNIDCITANPPYIRSSDKSALQPEVRDFEPERALISGTEGTEFHQRIIREAGVYLKHGGMLIMEMGLGQAQDLIAMIKTAGAYGAPDVLKDLAGIDRVITARKK